MAARVHRVPDRTRPRAHRRLGAELRPEKAPFDPSRSWLLGDARTLAIALAAVSAAVLVVAGLGLLAQAGWWRPVTVAGLAVSTAMIALYFNPWYLFISAVNLALIASIAWLSWPTRSMVGA